MSSVGGIKQIFPRHIFLFNGPPGSGKDTGGMIMCRLVNQAGYIGRFLKFADPLKNAVHAICGLHVAADYFEKKKEQQSEWLFGKTPREAYISASEDWAKKFWGGDFFSNVMIKRIMSESSGDKYIVITNCGFQTEVDHLVSVFGNDRVSVIQLERSGCNYSKDSRQPVVGLTTHCVQNNGTLKDLEEKLTNILQYTETEIIH